MILIEAGEIVVEKVLLQNKNISTRKPLLVTLNVTFSDEITFLIRSVLVLQESSRRSTF